MPSTLGAARHLLSSAVPAAVRGKGPAVALQRSVLNCLLQLGLGQREDGQFEVKAVHGAQLGEAVLAAVAAHARQHALYKWPGYELKDLLAKLQLTGLVSISYVDSAKYAAAKAARLLKHVTAAQLAAAQAPALPLPIPPPGAAAPAAAAGAVQVGLPGSNPYSSMPAASDASMAGASSSATTAVPIARPAAPRPPAQVGSASLPTPQLVTTEQAAAAAVDRLLAASEVAMDCEGALERGGSISLIQLYAPGCGSGGNAASSSSASSASSGGGGCCYVFDLHAMQPHVRTAAMRQLARLLESASTTKVRAWELPCSPALLLHRPKQAPAGARKHSQTAATPRLVQNCPHPASLPAGAARLPRRLRGALLPARHPLRRGLGHTGKQGLAAWGCTESADSLHIHPASPHLACSVSLETKGKTLPTLSQHLSSALPTPPVQVAFGLLQFLSSVGGSDATAAAGVNAPIGLNSLLSQYQLPPNPLKAVMHARMEREPHLFERRPLEAQVLQYAGGQGCRREDRRVSLV